MKTILALILLFIVACSAGHDQFIIVTKSKNMKPNWLCPSDTLVVVKNLKTNERSEHCGNLGNVGDTICLKF